MRACTGWVASLGPATAGMTRRKKTDTLSISLFASSAAPSEEGTVNETGVAPLTISEPVVESPSFAIHGEKCRGFIPARNVKHIMLRVAGEQTGGMDGERFSW